MIYKDSLKNKIKLLRKRPSHRLKIFLRYLWRVGEKDPVFIITTRRSGSNLLLGCLNSVPGVSFASEILNPSMYYGIRNRWIAKGAVLRHIAYSINNCEDEVCGAKLLKIHLDAHSLDLEDLKKHFPRAKFIVLYRRSLLEQFVSLKMAEKTNVWQWTEGQYRAPSSMHISIPELKNYCQMITSFYRGLFQNSWLKQRSVTVAYEDLASDAQKVFDGLIFPFLGVSGSAVSSPTHKQNTRPLQEAVENHSEVEKVTFARQEYGTQEHQSLFRRYA